MRTEYFKKNDLLSLINNRLNKINEKLNYSDENKYFSSLETILESYEEVLSEIIKVRKLIPLTHRAQYALLNQYSKNILKSLKISFKKNDYIEIESLIVEEIPSSMSAWRDFLNTIKW